MTSRHRRCALVAAALALLTSTASAQPVALAWDAPAECPDRDSVIARLHPASRDDRRTLTARVRVFRNGARWTMHLETTDGSQRGERDLSADTCAELADAAALIIALTLDGAISAPDAPTVVAPTPPAPRPALRFGLRVLAGVDAGAMPSVAPTVSLSATLQRAWWRVELGASWLASEQVTLASGRGADLDAGRVTLRGCAVPYARRIELRGCAGFDIGMMWGTGFGVPEPASGSAQWFGVRVGAEVAWRAARWLSLVALVDGSVLLDRPSFALRDGTELHTPSRFGLLAQAGAEAAW